MQIFFRSEISYHHKQSEMNLSDANTSLGSEFLKKKKK